MDVTPSEKQTAETSLQRVLWDGRKRTDFHRWNTSSFSQKKARMLGLRSVSSLVHCSRLLRPTVPIISRVFSDATPSTEQSPEQTQEQGDPEVINFIKKVMNILVLLFEDSNRE